MNKYPALESRGIYPDLIMESFSIDREHFTATHDVVGIDTAWSIFRWLENECSTPRYNNGSTPRYNNWLTPAILGITLSRGGLYEKPYANGIVSAEKRLLSTTMHDVSTELRNAKIKAKYEIFGRAMGELQLLPSYILVKP